MCHAVHAPCSTVYGISRPWTRPEEGEELGMESINTVNPFGTGFPETRGLHVMVLL